MKKIICFLLALTMILPTFATALAVEGEKILYGDADGDGVVSITDATAIQYHIAKLRSLDEKRLEAADVDGDGKITVLDATNIQKYIARLIIEFPVEKNENIESTIPTETTPDEKPTSATTMPQETIPSEENTVVPTEPTEPTEPSSEPVEKVIKVEGVRATVTSETTIDVQWDALEGAQKYWVYVNGAIKGSTTNCTLEVRKLVVGEIYQVSVTALLADGKILKLEDADTVKVEIKIEATEKTVKVTGVKASEITENSFIVSWNIIDGAKKYWIYIDDTLHGSTTSNEYTVLKLINNTDYRVYITALLSDGTILKTTDADTLKVTTLGEAKPTEPMDEETKLLVETGNKISKYQNKNTLTISLMSDTHFNSSEKDAYNIQKYTTFEHFGKVQNYANIDLAVNLGDIIDGNLPKEDTIEEIELFTKYTSEYCQSPLFFVRGNHDDNGWYSQGGFGGSYKTDEIINGEEWNDIVVKKYNKNVILDETNPSGCYGYFDDEKSKIRIFLLNTSDIPYIEEEDGTYRYNSYKGSCISNKQINFVAKSLLFEDKEHPEEWGALFLSHVPLDTSNEDNLRFGGKNALIRGSDYLLAVINAYHKGTLLKASGTSANQPTDINEDFMVNIDIDYSKKGPGEVIAFVSGHTHSDNFCDTVGIKQSLSYGFTYLGLVGSTAFSNFVIDRENKTITVIKHGKSIIEKTEGTLSETPDEGTIESGEWTVNYGKTIPNGENIYQGISEVWGMGDSLPSYSRIDKTTLELINTNKVTQNRLLTKASPVKPLTTYIIPKDFTGDCKVFNKFGGGMKSIYPVVKDGYMTLTLDSNSNYIVFEFYTDVYEDYEGFYIKEVSAFYPLSEQAVGSMNSSNIIMLNATLPVGTYTLKYEDECGIMENCESICTLTKKNPFAILSYTNFIRENKAPYNCKQIGVYNSNGERMGYIPLSENFINKAENKLYTFSATSDVHLGYDTSESDFKKALQYFNEKENVDFNVICGDLAIAGKEEELQKYKEIVDEYSKDTEVYVAAGNHEEYKLNSSEYFEKYTGNPLYYSFTRGDDVYIMVGIISTHENRLFAEGELQWLYETLEANRNKRCFVFQHIPIEGTSGDALNTLQGRTTKLANEKTSIAFKNLLSHYKNVIHFHGHTHLSLDSQKYDRNANYFYYAGSHSIHISSLSNPRIIDESGNSAFLGAPKDAEGYVVDVYKEGIVLRGVNLVDEKLIPIAQYYLETPIQNIEANTFVDSSGVIITP